MTAKEGMRIRWKESKVPRSQLLLLALPASVRYGIDILKYN